MRLLKGGMDFLSNHDGRCQSVSAVQFKVCDDSAHPMAYLDLTLSSRGCLVENPNVRDIIFRPIDRALYGSSGGRRCDLMLRDSNCSELCFVELKDWMVGGWFNDAVEQVENTIADFLIAHKGVFDNAHYKSAYVINLVHGFSRSHKEKMRDFVRKYHVILRTEQPIRLH